MLERMSSFLRLALAIFKRSLVVKTTTRFFIVALMALFLVTVAKESKAWRDRPLGGKHYPGHGQFTYGHKVTYGKGTEHHRSSRSYSLREGYFKGGYKSFSWYGGSYGKPYGLRLYGSYGYGEYLYYRYPYGYRRYHKSRKPWDYHGYQCLGPKTLRDYDEEFARGWSFFKTDRSGEAVELFSD